MAILNYTTKISSDKTVGEIQNDREESLKEPITNLTLNDLREMSVPIKIEQNVGVYFLFLDDEMVYVGQSKSVQARVFFHYFNQKKIFNRWCWVGCSIEELDVIEATFIIKFKPKYNISIPAITGYHRPLRIAKMLKIHGTIIKNLIKKNHIEDVQGKYDINEVKKLL